jgi:hypothetical protein
MTYKIEDVNMTYMGRKATLKNICKFYKSVDKCKDLSQIGAIVYIGRIVQKMDFDSESIDEIMGYAQDNTDELKHIAIKIIIDLKLKEVDDNFMKLIESNDTDVQYDHLYNFALMNRLKN